MHYLKETALYEIGAVEDKILRYWRATSLQL